VCLAQIFACRNGRIAGVEVVQFPGGISATSVFTMEQTRIFTASIILLKCSHDNLNRKKSGPSI